MVERLMSSSLGQSHGGSAGIGIEPRERAMVFLDMAAGLRRGELAGLKWGDFDFRKLQVRISRSLVDQQVGPLKTEASRKLMPIDEYVAQDLLAWYEKTPYRAPSDFVWATNAGRAGLKRGKQPVWLSTIMRYHVQPVARRAWDHEQHRMAQLPPYVLYAFEGQWGGCKSCAVALATCFRQDDA